MNLIKKSTSIFFLLLFSVIALSACSKDKNPELDDRFTTDETSHEGMVEALESIDFRQAGTHQLETTEGKTIIIQSPSINLNRYLGDEVKIEGSLEKAIGNAKAVFTVNEISYLDGSLSIEFDGYKNKSFGLKFEHPNNWKLAELGQEIELEFQEKNLVTIEVFSDESDIDSFLKQKEEKEGVEVTIGAQRSFRYISGSKMRFYVANPPKKKIYLIKYSPTYNSVDDPKEAEAERNHFYDLLDSFQLIYITSLSGEKCGGLQKLECPEESLCQLESDGKYAEGICVPLSGGSTASSCPFIATPSCNEYRISEYSQGGCPARYSCVSGSDEDIATFRDLNVILEGYDDEDESSDETDSSNEVDTKSEDEESEEDAEYEVPDVSKVSREYVNTRNSFSMLYPSSWYYASFGAIDGSKLTVGFSSTELEESENSIIKMTLGEEATGQASTKKDDLYYSFDGPSDLLDVMKAMADSLETF